jgi:hypothetical protein
LGYAGGGDKWRCDSEKRGKDAVLTREKAADTKEMAVGFGAGVDDDLRRSLAWTSDAKLW